MRAQSRGLNIPPATAQRALVGSGIEAVVEGKVLIAAADSRSTPQVEALEQAGQTVVAVMQDGVPMGMLALRDTCATMRKTPSTRCTGWEYRV